MADESGVGVAAVKYPPPPRHVAPTDISAARTARTISSFGWAILIRIKTGSSPSGFLLYYGSNLEVRLPLFSNAVRDGVAEAAQSDV